VSHKVAKDLVAGDVIRVEVIQDFARVVQAPHHDVKRGMMVVVQTRTGLPITMPVASDRQFETKPREEWDSEQAEHPEG